MSENIPLKENIDEYFKREVLPYVDDAKIDDETRGKIGYEIPFTKIYYVYTPLRSLNEIDLDLKENLKEILKIQDKVVD